MHLIAEHRDAVDILGGALAYAQRQSSTLSSFLRHSQRVEPTKLCCSSRKTEINSRGENVFGDRAI